MSYCRFSNSDFQCDIYCYESAEGFVINVARTRVVFDKPLPPPIIFSEENIQEWMDRNKKVGLMIEQAHRQPINLPFDGESFLEHCAADASVRLVSLRDLGYRVPQYAIDALIEESLENTPE